MSDSTPPDPSLDRIAETAASWVVRCDRGLTAVEQDEYSAWLAADPRHPVHIARHREHWNRLDLLAQWRPEHSSRPNPDLLAPAQRVRVRRLVPALGLAAAAAIAFAAILWRTERAPELPEQYSPVAAATGGSEFQRVLADGSVIELNRGAVVSVHYSQDERRVHLERGEAHFAVAKDPSRPFVVTAGGVDVRAVGTMFNVRVNTAAVEVLVTEGRVQVNAAPEPRGLGGKPSALGALRENDPEAAHAPVLEARQRAVVSRTPDYAPPQIATLTAGEIERVLAWQHRLLDFTATPLSEIAAEFNRRNVVQLVLLDPELASVRISAKFRSDNIDGFVRLLEVGFGVKAEPRGRLEIVLQKKRRE